MTPAGWTLMLLSCGFVTCLAAFCYCKVLCTPRETEHMQAPIEIDTHDRGT